MNLNLIESLSRFSRSRITRPMRGEADEPLLEATAWTPERWSRDDSDDAAVLHEVLQRRDQR